MIMGGIPYYWSLLKKGKSLPQNIDNLFFKEGAPLANEYENLYSALFNKPEQYMKIVEALSTVNKGITRDEISEITGIASSGDLTRKLTELENCGFISKYVPFGYKKRKISDFIKKTETKYAIHLTLITTYGVEDNSYSGDIQAIITSDDLFT